MRHKLINFESGYIALVSVVIMSAVLLLILVAVGGTSVSSRLGILSYEYKLQSSSLADGCVDVALLKLINNSNYNPTNELVKLGANTCTIVSVTSNGGQKIIQVRGIYPETGVNRSYTNLQVQATVSNGNIVVNSWEEVAHF